MKKLLILAVLLIGLTSCEREQLDCNCQVEGWDQVRTVSYPNGVQVIQSSEPLWIEPYDTIVNCDQNQVEWTNVTRTQHLEAGYTDNTSFRRINCN